MNDLMEEAELKFPSLMVSKVGVRIRSCGSQRSGSCSLVWESSKGKDSPGSEIRIQLGLDWSNFRQHGGRRDQKKGRELEERVSEGSVQVGSIHVCMKVSE